MSTGSTQDAVRRQMAAIQGDLLYEEEQIRTRYKAITVMEDEKLLEAALRPVEEKRQALALAIYEIAPAAETRLSAGKEISQKLTGRPDTLKLWRVIIGCF